MRTIAGVIAVLGMVATGARAEPPRTVAVADLGLHVVGVGAQRTLSARLAGEITLDFYGPWTQLRHDGLAAGDLTGAVVRARVFVFLRDAPVGWWASPFAQGGVGSGARAGGSRTGPLFAAGASIGYAWLLGSVHVAIGAGAQYHVAAIPGGDGPPRFAGVWPQLDLLVGWAL